MEVYAQKDFLAIQMRQIRLGLMENLPVEWYAKTDYDWFQMKEIRLGLEEGVDVSYYRSPMYTALQMRERRCMLAKNPAAFLRECLEKEATDKIVGDSRRQKETATQTRQL